MFRAKLARLAQLFNNINLRQKLFISNTLVVFIPIMIAGVFLTSEFRQMALDNAVEQMDQNVDRVLKRTMEALKVPIDISGKLLVDTQLKDLVGTRYESALEATISYRSYYEFNNNLKTYEELSQFRFYVDNPTLLNSWEIVPLDESVASTFWYQRAVEEDGRIGWYYVEDPMKYKPSTLSMVRKMEFFNTFTYGVLVIDINTSYLNSILSQESFETMIVDSNRYIVAAGNPELAGRPLDESIYSSNIATLTDGIHDLRIDGIDYKVVIEDYRPELSYNSLKIISIFAVDTIVQEANKIGMLGLSAMGTSIVVAIFLIYGVSTWMSRRLMKLKTQINKVASGNLQTTLEVDGTDEIGVLSRQFNAMVRNINMLMAEVEESNRQKHAVERKQSEMKLKMMASQINPHFLFNALESIRMKAHISGQPQIAQTVKLLGRLMRKNIEITGNDIELMDELDMVRCYLDIQNFRYEDRLQYSMEIDPQAEKVKIQPLIIQPLVENAVIHGLEGMVEGGMVTIKASLTEDRLLIEVCDDGVGMGEGKLQELRELLEHPDRVEGSDRPHRIGLINVHERLRLSYGMSYGLSIDSSPNHGTCVRFFVPLQQNAS